MLEKLKNKANLGLILVIIFSLISFFYVNQRKQETKAPAAANLEFDLANEAESGAEPEKTETPEVIIVDVKGEVNQPGIYEVKSDMRVNDVIQLAKGLTKEADEDQLNLAQKVADEMIIQVPKANDQSIDSDPSDSEANLAGSNSDKIKLNQASLEELTTLTGIGPSKAEAIIAYRDEVGMFKDVDELVNVSGIGEKTLEAIKDDLQAP